MGSLYAGQAYVHLICHAGVTSQLDAWLDRLLPTARPRDLGPTPTPDGSTTGSRTDTHSVEPSTTLDQDLSRLDAQLGDTSDDALRNPGQTDDQPKSPDQVP